MKAFKLFAAATIACLGSAPLASNATTLQLCLFDGVTQTCVIDGAAGDANPVAGVVTFIGSIGVWNINVSTGQGDATTAGLELDLNSLNNSTAAGTLRLTLTETDLNWGASGPLTLNGGIGGTTDGNVSFALLADDDNLLYSDPLYSGTTVFSGGPIAGGSFGQFAAGGSGTVGLTDPFSLTLLVDIVHFGRGNTSFDIQANVPEPGTLALLGFGLLGLGMRRRRTR